MEFFIDYWYIILAFIVVCVVIGVAIYYFVKKPTSEQLEAVKEWLLWAVTKAERELGGKTGQLKLRMVYDMFVVRFPWLAKIISFSMVSDWVDEALIKMRKMLETNEAVQAIVEGDAKCQ